MLRLFVFSAILSAAVVAAACDSYDPDLGATPYRCNASEPKCPDGYDAVEVGPPNMCECHRPSGSDAPDSGPSCADPGEPNETTATATQTSIGSGSFTGSYNNMSICTSADVDTYKFNTTKPNQTMTAMLQFSPTVGQLLVRIVDSQNTPLATGMPMGAAVIATFKFPTTGVYYVQVYSSAGTNTYGLSMSLTD